MFSPARALAKVRAVHGCTATVGDILGCSAVTNQADLYASLPQAIQQFSNRWACNYSPFERFLMRWFESHWFFFLIRRTTKRRENTSTSLWFPLLGFSQHILQAKWKHLASASQTMIVIEWSNCLPVRSWAFSASFKVFKLNANQSPKERKTNLCCK